MARNKVHKSKFSSKRSQKQNGKKIKSAKNTSKSVKNLRGGFEPGHKNSLSNRRKYLLQQKAQKLEKEKAIGKEGPPRIVGLTGLNERANVEVLYNKILAECDTQPISSLPRTIWHRTLRWRMTIVPDTEDNEQKVIDMAKVCDIILLVLDCSASSSNSLSKFFK